MDTSYTFSNYKAEDSIYVAVTCYDNSGDESWYSNEILVILNGTTNMTENSFSGHKDFLLFQNFPNPFNQVTIFSYQLPKQSNVNLSIFNTNGQLVETLVNEYQNIGYHTVQWNAHDIHSGVYFFQIKIDYFMDVKKCLIID